MMRALSSGASLPRRGDRRRGRATGGAALPAVSPARIGAARAVAASLRPRRAPTTVTRPRSVAYGRCMLALGLIMILLGVLLTLVGLFWAGDDGRATLMGVHLGATSVFIAGMLAVALILLGLAVSRWGASLGLKRRKERKQYTRLAEQYGNEPRGDQ